VDLSRSARTHPRSDRGPQPSHRDHLRPPRHPGLDRCGLPGRRRCPPPSDLAMPLNNQSVDLAAPTRPRGRVRPGPWSVQTRW